MAIQDILPAGWHVQNSTGTFNAPAQSYSDEEDEGPARPRRGDDGLDEEDLRPDSPGWEDVEPAEDLEVVEVTCLCCGDVFRSSGAVREMVRHCKEVHGLDLDALRRRDCEYPFLDPRSVFASCTRTVNMDWSLCADMDAALDFFATIRLVNYIRHHYAQQPSTSTTSSQLPDTSSAELWADDKFLQPVLEDDALLYSIDELADPDDPSDPLATADDEVEEAGKGKEAVRAERVVVERALR